MLCITLLLGWGYSSDSRVLPSTVLHSILGTHLKPMHIPVASALRERLEDKNSKAISHFEGSLR